MHFISPRFLNARTMITIALYIEPEEQQDNKSDMNSARSGGMSGRSGSNSQRSSNSNNTDGEDEDEDENDNEEDKEQSKNEHYNIYSSVKRAKNSKINFYIFAINIRFKKKEDFEEAQNKEFCILNKYIAFQLQEKNTVRILKIPSFEAKKNLFLKKEEKNKKNAEKNNGKERHPRFMK